MLTIILPVYNAEKYLERCLNSVLSQSFKDFEVILINDGSKDNSPTICESFANKDKRIIYINQANQGVAMARNQGLNKAKGDYIGFVDADDVLEEAMFQNLINPTLKKAYDVVLAHYKICNTDDFTIPKSNLLVKKDLDQTQIKNTILKTYYTGSDPLVPALWNKIYKRHFLEQNKLIFKNQKAVRASDYWFNFDVFQKAIDAIVIPNANYCYNNEISGSIINTFRENQFQGFLETQKKLLNANKTFKFKIDYTAFYEPFFNNTNQFILAAIGYKGFLNGYSLIKPILKNEEFHSSFKYVKLQKLHVKWIQVFIKYNLILMAYAIYGLWFLKFKRK